MIPISGTVAIFGWFDPVREEQIEFMEKAARLGKRLLIITYRDSICAQYSDKKICEVPLRSRVLTLEGLLLRLNLSGKVIVAVDEDGSIAKTLWYYKPDVLARGTNRITPGERNICKEIKCRVVHLATDKVPEICIPV